jgi:hypothetical protein
VSFCDDLSRLDNLCIQPEKARQKKKGKSK